MSPCQTPSEPRLYTISFSFHHPFGKFYGNIHQIFSCLRDLFSIKATCHAVHTQRPMELKFHKHPYRSFSYALFVSNKIFLSAAKAAMFLKLKGISGGINLQLHRPLLMQRPLRVLVVFV